MIFYLMTYNCHLGRLTVDIHTTILRLLGAMVVFVHETIRIIKPPFMVLDMFLCSDYLRGLAISKV